MHKIIFSENLKIFCQYDATFMVSQLFYIMKGSESFGADSRQS